jgi:RNA polymerase sigma factor (sigma-70 family)
MAVLATAGVVVGGEVTWHERVEALYRRNRASMVGLAATLVDDPERAAELVQDVFAAMLVGRPPAPGSELAYLRRSVINRGRGELRRRRVQRSAVLPRPVDMAAPDEVRRAVVLAAIRRLPRRQQECVVLRYYADLGDEDIAATLGISPGSVKQHLHRARSSIALTLGEEA